MLVDVCHVVYMYMYMTMHVNINSVVSFTTLYIMFASTCYMLHACCCIGLYLFLFQHVLVYICTCTCMLTCTWVVIMYASTIMNIVVIYNY